MNDKQKKWEEELNKHLGADGERFPVSDGYFDNLEDRIRLRMDLPVKRKKTARTYLWAAAILPLAAALTFFLLNRENVQPEVPQNPALMGEAVEQWYRIQTEETILPEIDSQTVAEAKNLEQYENLQAEVVAEDLQYEYLDEESEEDPLADLRTEDIEDYLVDYLDLNSEL